MDKSKSMTPIQSIRNDLERMSPQFKSVLPSNITPQKFIRTAMTSIQTTPSLMNVDRRSLFAEIMKCAQDSLLPNGDEAAIVPFKDQAKYMPMVKGILKKVRNSGELASITAQVVHENDKFKFWVDGDGEHLMHEPVMFGDRGKEIGVYALAKCKDGAVYIEVLTNEDLEKIKNVSRGKNTPWNGPFAGEMKKKSAIRRLSKRLPMSTDVEMIIKQDDDLYDFEEDRSPIEDKPETKDITKPQRLSKLMAEEAEADVIETYSEETEEPAQELSDDEVPI